MRRNSKSSYEPLEDDTFSKHAPPQERENSVSASEKIFSTTYTSVPVVFGNNDERIDASTNLHQENKPRDNTSRDAPISSNKKSKNIPNFIERNKKLAETPKMASKQNQQIHVSNQQQQTNVSSKTGLKITELVTPVKNEQRNTKTPKSAEKLSKKAASHLQITNAQIKQQPTNKGRGSKNDKNIVETNNNIKKNNRSKLIHNGVEEGREPTESTLVVPLMLRQRSLTFESRETFLKFDRRGSSASSPMNKISDATELDCIEVFAKYDEVEIPYFHSRVTTNHISIPVSKRRCFDVVSTLKHVAYLLGYKYHISYALLSMIDTSQKLFLSWKMILKY